MSLLYNQKIKFNILQFKDLLISFFPKGKREYIIFVFFFLVYFSYALIIVFNTSIIDHENIRYDIYFSFDNPEIYKYGYLSMERHILMRHFSYLYILVGDLLQHLLGLKAKTILTVLICNTAITLSIIYVYRYIRKILNIQGLMSYFLASFYGFFSTNLILSFTPESFTFSVFLISFTLYYYSCSIKENQNVGFLSNAALAIGLGGITITNLAKGIIPMFFIKDKPIRILIKIACICLIFGGIIILLRYYYADEFGVIITIKNSFISNALQKQENILYKIIDWFFIAPIYFPEIIQRPIQLFETSPIFPSINLDYFHNWYNYLFAIILYILLVAGIIRNFRERLLWLLIAMFSVDIIIHVIVGYGLQDPFIYGGHWVFIVPVLIGWLYKSLSDNVKKYLVGTVFILFLVMLINNSIRMVEFISRAIVSFPVQSY